MYKGNGRFKVFRGRPKWEARKELGREYTDFLIGCLRDVAGSEVGLQIVFDENCPVDFVWEYLLLGMEGKRLRKTRFRNDGHARAWLKREFLDRFAECAKEYGIVLEHRILCCTERFWSSEVDSWLEAGGARVIYTGQIDTIAERELARENFVRDFVEVVWQICEEEKEPLKAVV